MTLQEFFGKYKKVAIALSGGVDSAYLMYAAKKCGADVQAYFAKTEFQPEFELRDAEEAAKACGVSLCVINFSALENEAVAKNQCDRCYHCKKGIMQIIKAMAMSDGYDILCDGTNASDDVSDRPGYRALGELGIISPLKMCGITKDEVRRSSKKAGMLMWDKPAYACLATRIKTGEEITAEKLAITEAAEDFLRGLGFSDFRVRMQSGSAKLEVKAHDMEEIIKNRRQIVAELKKNYRSVIVDLEARDEKLSD